MSSALRGREVAQYSSDDDFKIVIQILKLKRKKDSAIRGKLMDEKLCVYSSIMADQRKPTTLDEYYMFDDQGYQPNNELGTSQCQSVQYQSSVLKAPRRTNADCGVTSIYTAPPII